MAPKKPIKNQPSSNKGTKASPSRHKEESSFSQIVKFLKDERTHYILGLFIAVIVIFLLLSFVSYFFTGAADKSVFDNIGFRESIQIRSSVKNWTSVLGAFFSETLIDNWFGISAFAILFFLIAAALKLMKVKFISVWKAFFHSFFWLIWLSVFLGFITRLVPYIQPTFFSLGGKHGEFISEELNSFIGVPGTGLALLAALIIYFIFTWNGTIHFLNRVLFKKNKNTFFDEEEERQVAVGTEIVPEEWMTRNNSKTSQDLLDEEDEELEELVEKVSFEVTKAPKTEEEDVVEEYAEEENDDPNYNIGRLGKYDPTLDLSSYKPPTLDLLKVYGNEDETQVDMAEQNANKNRIISTLKNFGIEIDSIKATVGPTITLYEIVPKSGIRISKIRNLESDIMLSLAATGIRIIAPIPGKGTIGIEVPNQDPQVVSMHSVIASKKFQEAKFDLPVVFGKTITNEVFMVDLTKMPHLLVAGATGQGKSVGLNAIITSLLYKKHPSQLKFVLVDPKKVEFNIYAAIEKHFLAKLPDGEDAIITDTSKVVQTLNSLCIEMDDRYDLLKKAHVRNIKEYNEKFFNRQLNPEKGHRFLPYIVVIVDEFGDLIMTAGKEVEMPIARIAQLARAVGIHMIIATQRPSVNIITGVIKANFPARVAFRVSSMIDSRTILDAPGANQLVGRGDMLFSQGSDLIRVQCAFVDTPEVEDIALYIGQQRGYPTAFYLPEYVGPEGEGIDVASVDMTKRDPMFEEAARLMVASQVGSTSNIQRKFSIGYNRAGRIMDQLEVAGIVGPSEGSKARQVLVQTEYELEHILKHLG
ncbi:Cell division protein FtsK/SpoIIIE [uncultured Paludibacter sp.]|uniref:Cell division protein FtsK/SpoIIIE n=1 Tax=uncultured Paludibacter sp. TaxID=497635 RepID=A0A653AJW3_9BACT|nr:Cell division protein FtsK/SpoIIIE [uncultured Paludibacter sp.]